MIRIISTLVCATIASCLYAQPVWLPTGPLPSGGTYSSQFRHVFTGMHNQAALAQLPALTAGAYTERRFMMKALSTYALALAIPAPPGAFGLTFVRFGAPLFYQQQLGLGYGRSLGDKVSIGLQADYLTLTMQQYGSAATFTFEAGCLLHITQQLYAGFHVFNPPARQLDKSGQQEIPVVYTAGLGYEASSAFLLSVEVIRETGQAFTTRVMSEYRLISQLSLQLGLATDPQLNGAGVSFSWEGLRIHLYGNYHPQLGITPATAVIWQLKKGTTLP
ncbi:hypothetical protein [uncultured Chitinophaga sp.]|jgi:hypothetical protein|uniref:hypothetical protein n=1 Tax=uncultured Chitinophaga sp. TaxID=339340 RepID=UPI00261B18F5|nr:hypothetical protein [uncultured Chitinophaga sp.]